MNPDRMLNYGDIIRAHEKSQRAYLVDPADRAAFIDARLAEVAAARASVGGARLDTEWVLA